MAQLTEVEGPPPYLRYKRRIKPATALKELWRARELIRSVAERDLRVRYKQATLGIAWAVLAPLAMMMVLSIFVRRVIEVGTGGIPYPLFVYLGIVPWAFFSSSVSSGGQSLLSNKGLLNRIYCPREVFPIASVVVAAIDMTMAFLALSVLFPLTGFWPKATSFWVITLLPIQISFALGAAMLVSSIVIYFRDLTHAVPLLLQLGFFATPIFYGLDVVPESLHQIYATINPMVAVVDGYRRSVLGGMPPHWNLVLFAALGAATYLIVGYTAFKKLEVGVADVA